MSLNDVRSAWLPPPVIRSVDWVPQHVRTTSGGEYDGLYNFDIAPHTRHVYELFDDDYVREIYLDWGTRGMKTSTMIGCLIAAAALCPRPAAFGSADEMSVDRTIDELIYPTIENCEPLADQLPPPHQRSRDMIRLRKMRVRKAYGGSKASVAGYPACYIFVNEVDKWPIRKSSEADAVEGFRQRAKGYPFESKVILESTPGELETSRIWRLLTAPTTNRKQYWVPCPRCGEYQLLVFDRDHVIWDKDSKGKSDMLIAQQTAWYRCEHCHGRIENEDRPEMMRAGLWLSDGQKIDNKGRVTGKPKVESPYVGLGPLSTLYSLLISGWGQVAADFLRCGKDPEKLRDFQNSTLALPWNPKPVSIEPDELATRLGSDEKRGICPPWSIFLTAGVDVQENGDVFKWWISAWGHGGRGAEIAHGIAHGEEELKTVLKSQFPHADGGGTLRCLSAFIDSGDGNVMNDVYDLCRRFSFEGLRCLPSKGSSTSGFPLAVRKKPLDEDGHPIKPNSKIKGGGIVLIEINTERSQQWIEKHIKGRCAGDAPDRYTICQESMLDFEMLAELANETKYQGRWQKTGDNDFRDAARYAWAVAMMITNDGKLWYTLPARPQPGQSAAGETKSERRERRRNSNSLTKGGGRQWPSS